MLIFSFFSNNLHSWPFLCLRGYVSNNSGQLFSFPVIFALEVGEGQIPFLGICEGSRINPIWEVGGARVFSQKKF